MLPTCTLQKTVVALFCLLWLVFCLALTQGIHDAFKNGNWRYENRQYLPDTNPLGDLERQGHITTPNHVPPRPLSAEDKQKELCSGPIDVVFTWVNGSDPGQMANLRKFHGDPVHLSIMYRDYGTLRFAIRSIEKFAPWIDHVFLVTNGQQPDWYNKSANKTTLVTHAQIFSKLENLPTFNSNAIESNLYKIPGLSECFLFMNDDFFLASPTPKDYFIDPDNGMLNLHFEKRTAPAEKEMKTNGWFRSVAHSNEMVSNWYYPSSKSVVRHHFSSHYCYFMSKRLLTMMALRWPEQWEYTERNRFRNDKDNAIPFLHVNVALEEGIGKSKPSNNAGGSWTSNHTLNVATWKRIVDRRSPAYCSCLQDRMDPTGQETENEILYLEEVLCGLLPEKSSVELSTAPNPCDKYKK